MTKYSPPLGLQSLKGSNVVLDLSLRSAVSWLLQVQSTEYLRCDPSTREGTSPQGAWTVVGTATWMQERV